MSSGPKQQRGRNKRTRNPNRRSIKIHRNYTVEEAARTTGCAKGTIRRWIKSGALPAITDIPRSSRAEPPLRLYQIAARRHCDLCGAKSFRVGKVADVNNNIRWRRSLGMKALDGRDER
jgi:excisionase family DNA binding protein